MDLLYCNGLISTRALINPWAEVSYKLPSLWRVITLSSVKYCGRVEADVIESRLGGGVRRVTSQRVISHFSKKLLLKNFDTIRYDAKIRFEYLDSL